MSRIEIGVLGAGRFAEVVTSLLSLNPRVHLRLWARKPEALERLRPSYPKVELSSDIAVVTSAAELVIFAVPAGALESVGALYGPYAKGDQIVVHAARGAAEGFTLPHQAIRKTTCVRKIIALGGPLHAREIETGRPLATVAASRFPRAIEALRAVVADTPIRIHPSRDVVGVEVAGAIANVAQLAAGISDGLELGETARGMLLARGLTEGQRIGMALGADPTTFLGLAGVGELIPRKVSSTSRHHELGIALAKGVPLDRALPQGHSAVEGVATALGIAELAKRRGLKLPLARAVEAILRGEESASAAILSVLQLDLDDFVMPKREGSRA
ncbi:MAG: NAD(P)H-dependent glycerol-3-phosphate dehydrogenase [Myxococcota bacterium]